VLTLEQSKVFGKLKPAELEALRRIAQERSFASGQEIFREGDAGDGLYLVKSGLVEISGLLTDKARHVFLQAGPGDMFGEMAVIEDKPRSAGATARQSTKAWFFSRPDMLALVETSPALSLVLLREISSRLREFDRQYLREALQTERLAIIGRFARSIVHDLKNPLNIIGLTAEIAGAENASGQTRQQAQARIRKQVERISDMIGEILDFTQGSQSAFVLVASDYSQFVQQLLEELRAEVALKSVSIELDGAVPPVKVLLDPKRLRRVFFNLVHNATDAMPRGGKVSVRAKLDSKEVVTEIQDTGSGIAPEIANDLFEAFTTHGKAHGTGLGLSICKKIVLDHHGWISARNGASGGAIFSFALPISKG
jgi:signal transduction histidine kinase